MSKVFAGQFVGLSLKGFRLKKVHLNEGKFLVGVQNNLPVDLPRECCNFNSKLVPRHCSSLTCELEITHPVALDPHLLIATPNQYLKG